jgi:3-deoxy-D-manno-octulosonic-acid transferase
MLRFFTHLFVQDEPSHDLLKKFGIQAVSVVGDTRFDRVLTIATAVEEIEGISAFAGSSKVVVAGSTWPGDENMLHAILKKFSGIKLVLAPHEVDDEHIKNVTQLFQKSIRYSALKNLPEADRQQQLIQANVLIIDNVGMLSKLYQYATIAYIGGGFNKSGIHNTLEAAVFGKPVLFGPNYQKFREARALLAAGGAFSYTAETELQNKLEDLLGNETTLQKTGAAAGKYVQEQGGATQKIMMFIQENRLLTN